MQFLRLPKSQIYLAISLGCISGYFVWAEPIRQYVQENSIKDNINEVSLSRKKNHLILTGNRIYPMTSVKTNIKTPVKLFVGLGGVMALILGYKFYGQRYIRNRKHETAEMYANFIYDKMKEEKGDIDMGS